MAHARNVLAVLRLVVSVEHNIVRCICLDFRSLALKSLQNSGEAHTMSFLAVFASCGVVGVQLGMVLHCTADLDTGSYDQPHTCCKNIFAQRASGGLAPKLKGEG